MARISAEDCVKTSAPWLIPLLLIVVRITFVPETVLWLPRILKELGNL